MPRIGMRRVALALATVTLATMSGLSGVGTAHAASDFSLVILPDQGESAICNFVNSATSSIDMTIYELNDTTLENDLVRCAAADSERRVLHRQHLAVDRLVRRADQCLVVTPVLSHVRRIPRLAGRLQR
jgi:hypothetical protein